MYKRRNDRNRDLETMCQSKEKKKSQLTLKNQNFGKTSQSTQGTWDSEKVGGVSQRL